MVVRMNNKELFSKWLSESGPEGDIVLSSRIRLARNIKDIPYPNNASDEDLLKVNTLIQDVLKDKDKVKLNYLSIDNMDELEKYIFVEKYLISPAHVKEGVYRGLLTNREENISAMINEEDHIRIQVFLSGLNLKKAWDKADMIDDLLEEKLDFAFSEKWGYLSACPTNMGTGLRASVMMHLPALNLTNNIDRMLSAISKLGLVIRGIYGEGSDSSGNIYQISNQVTLGLNENDIIDNLESITKQIIGQEKNARKRLVKEQESDLKDSIYRAFGVLKNAYKINIEEAMELISNVRLGIDMGIIDNIDPLTLNQLIVLIRPAHLKKIMDINSEGKDNDIKRAKLIRNRLL